MSRFSRSMLGLFGWLFSIGFTLLILGGGAGILLFSHYSKDLPDYSQLSKYDPETVTRLYAADGKLMAEYATERRVFVPLKAIPKTVISAFLSAEDKNFYQHTGIDFTGLARAVRDNVNNYGQGKSLVGGSTITQQVVKNFLLSNEKSIERKVKEAILAMRISRVYSKDKILELYLNEIYLGLGSYGVAAAAQSYFNKSLDELTVEEAALLATQPKAPALYNPRKNYDAAKTRRDWVIDRMRDDGHITTAEAQTAKDTPITLRERDNADIVKADFFAEEVRRSLAAMYGGNVLYQGGLVVKTTLDPGLQKAADAALRKALIDYDRRRGYRGPVFHFSRSDEWKIGFAALQKDQGFHLLEGQRFAVVSTLDERKAQITFEDGSRGNLPFLLMKWTRRVIADGQLGPEVKRPADILKVGDVVIAAPLSDEEKKLFGANEQKTTWSLAQVPEVNGAMVVLDPHTGRVLAMSGGYTYGGTEFNRATQAKRQPGSAFKPFVYLAGLENGFTPSTIILDAPVELSQGAGQGMWKPANYHNEYLGPTTMRVGLEKSRNTMTVRLTQIMGIDKALEIGKRFGIYDEPPRNFSIVLGTSETTLLRLANAYGIIANGGMRIKPSLIERIDDRHGKTIYRRDGRACEECKIAQLSQLIPNIMPPVLADTREVVVDPRVDYQMISMLQGVATRGTAARSKDIGKIVAGKTGTTNESFDTWFVGFAPDLVAGVYIGYDKPRTLGKKETGSSVALPAFIDFMKTALKDTPNKPFRVPRGIELVKVDLHSGLPAGDAVGGKVIEEAYVTGPPIFIPGVNSPPSFEENPTGDVVVDPPDDLSHGPVKINPRPEHEDALPDVYEEPATPPPAVGTGGLY